MEKYEPPKVHELNDTEKKFISSLSVKEMALHNLAVQKLGSSYFVWKTHSFQDYKAKKDTNNSK